MENHRKKTTYLIEHDGQYLSAMVGSKYETNPEKMNPRFSIYKYDAARIPRASIAWQIINILRKEGEHWSVVRFQPLDGVVERL